MDDKPKSIWKKSWNVPRWVLFPLLFLLSLGGLVPLIFHMVTDRSGFKDYFALFAGLGAITVLVISIFLLIRWLSHPRNRWRTLFGFACLMTLIALFYAEEDWRGRHAWNNFKRQWEAKGEHFDSASLIPPPVPEDQNFALTPIVASCYEMYFDKTGHQVWPRNTNVVNRLALELYHQRGQWPSADHKPALGNWQAGAMTDLKAWQGYYRAPDEGLSSRFFTNTFPTAPQPQTPAQDVLLALSKYDSTIEELRATSRLPYSRFPLEYDKDDPAEVLLPHLAAMKGCCQVLELRAIAELQNSQIDNAFADVGLMLRLTDSMRTEPILVSQLVRAALANLALQPVWEGLAEHKWSDAQLTELDAKLAKLDFVADYQAAMRGEMILFQGGIIDYLRRHPEQISKIGVVNASVPGTDQMVYRLIPSGWFYENQLCCARAMLELYLPAVDAKKNTIAPAFFQRAELAISADGRRFKPYHFLEELLLPMLANAARKIACGQSSVDLARVACGLERYRLAHGKFPESLDAFGPTFAAILPHDVIGGQPLKYRRTSNGQYVLYSIGWNEKDDGGTVVLNKDGTVDLANGDWVWQYPVFAR